MAQLLYHISSFAAHLFKTQTMPPVPDPNSFPARERGKRRERECSAAVLRDRKAWYNSWIPVQPHGDPWPASLACCSLPPSPQYMERVLLSKSDQNNTHTHTNTITLQLFVVAVINSGNQCLINYHTDLLKIILLPFIGSFIICRNVVDISILFGEKYHSNFTTQQC